MTGFTCACHRDCKTFDQCFWHGWKIREEEAQRKKPADQHSAQEDK